MKSWTAKVSWRCLGVSGSGCRLGRRVRPGDVVVQPYPYGPAAHRECVLRPCGCRRDEICRHGSA